jgi:hypothetical protein
MQLQNLGGCLGDGIGNPALGDSGRDDISTSRLFIVHPITIDNGSEYRARHLALVSAEPGVTLMRARVSHWAAYSRVAASAKLENLDGWKERLAGLTILS